MELVKGNTMPKAVDETHQSQLFLQLTFFATK
jgi:hypothetical protein